MKLFEPIRMGQMDLKNRICMPAIHHCYAPEGLINDRLLRYYEARARGGAGLITVGGCSIDRLGTGPMMIGLHEDRFIPGMAQLAAVIKENGAAASAQLYQAGRYTHAFIEGAEPIAPSPVASRLNRHTPREMTLEDIATAVENYGEAARRAREAGFDAVEVLASAGYLVCQFLSPLTNLRTDHYGGSWENRCRFALEVLERIREKTGSTFTVLFRISGHDFLPGGNDNGEAVRFATALAKAGVDGINVTGGWHESRVPQITGDLPRGAFAYLARAVKAAVQVPVIASNRINDPLVAEMILRHHLADLVNMGRPLIADPDLPNKARFGEKEAIRRCIACNQGCLDMVFSLQPVYCSINPLAGREHEITVTKTGKPRRVLIVGGGPAGLETARTAALRGHRVILWEKTAQLGGNLRYAAMPAGKEDFITLLDFYEHELPRLGVEVALNREAGAAEIIANGADAVVLATGARGAEPPFPVLDPSRVVSALAVLDGTVIPGERVVVIGGGSVGCETAAAIAEMGAISAGTLKFLFENEAETPERLHELLNRGTRSVTLVELEKGLGRDMGISTRWIALKCLRRLGVQTLEEHTVKEVNTDGVLVQKDGVETLLPADTVVLAVGAVAVDELAAELQGRVPVLHLIGDAAGPRKITEAVREGFDLALTF